jgi:hypothetical protein
MFKNIVACMRYRRAFILYQKNRENPNINHLSTVKTTFLKNTLMQVFAVKDLFCNSETLHELSTGWQNSYRTRKHEIIDNFNLHYGRPSHLLVFYRFTLKKLYIQVLRMEAYSRYV